MEWGLMHCIGFFQVRTVVTEFRTYWSLPMVHWSHREDSVWVGTWTEFGNVLEVKAVQFGHVLVNGRIEDDIKCKTSDDSTKKEHINDINERTSPEHSANGVFDWKGRGGATKEPRWDKQWTWMMWGVVLKTTKPNCWCRGVVLYWYSAGTVSRS